MTRGLAKSPEAFLKEFPLLPQAHKLLELVRTGDPGKSGAAHRMSLPPAPSSHGKDRESQDTVA